MSADDIQLLAQIRQRNQAFLIAGIEYAERKKRLFEFAMRFRTKLIDNNSAEEKPSG